MSENGCRVFPIITNAVQKEYEKCSMNTKSSDRTPEICGYKTVLHLIFFELMP